MSVDSWRTFRLHLTWAAIISLPLGVSIWLGHSLLVIRVWSVLALLVCTLPVLMWRLARRETEFAQPVVVPESETERSAA